MPSSRSSSRYALSLYALCSSGVNGFTLLATMSPHTIQQFLEHLMSFTVSFNNYREIFLKIHPVHRAVKETPINIWTAAKVELIPPTGT